MRISGSRWQGARRAPLALLVFGLVFGLVGGVAAVLLVGVALHGGSSTPRPPERAPVAVVAPEAGPVSVTRAVSSLAILRDWDRSRAAAWADGDARALARLYVDGSGAGARDVAMLRAWRDRGLRVEGMSMQVLAVELRTRTARRVVLVVTDRLVGAQAVGRGDRRALPRDDPTTRRLVFRQVGGRWLLESARHVE